MASQDPRLVSEALRAALHSATTVKRKSPLGALGAVVLIATIGIMLIVFSVPVLAPQATCDVLAPILGCEGGATPTCTMVGSGGTGRRSGQDISVRCPEGGGSAVPIYVATISVGVVSFIAGLSFVITRARRRRREDLASRR